MLYLQKKGVNTNAMNVRRNIREVMDEKNLDASTLAAQRQESERLARVQEQQRIIREVCLFDSENNMDLCFLHGMFTNNNVICRFKDR